MHRYRQAHAPELFLGAFLPGPNADGKGRTLIGYVCATRSPDDTLTHESMETHVPGSPSICIHSVCVHPDHRRKRVGLDLLKEFVAQAELAAAEGAEYERILLITHDELRGFYEQAGFKPVGLSYVVHGARPWYEMRRELRGADHALAQAPPPEKAQELPAGLWDALQRSSTRTRPAARLLTSFPNGVKDVVSNIDGDGAASLPANTYDLLCPRPGCGSVILKSGVASWVERESMQLDLPGQSVPECLGALPVPPATAQWWLVKPNPMAFENIGFSRAVHTTGMLAIFQCLVEAVTLSCVRRSRGRQAEVPGVRRM